MNLKIALILLCIASSAHAERFANVSESNIKVEILAANGGRLYTFILPSKSYKDIDLSASYRGVQISAIINRSALIEDEEEISPSPQYRRIYSAQEREALIAQAIGIEKGVEADRPTPSVSYTVGNGAMNPANEFIFYTKYQKGLAICKVNLLN